MRTHHAALVLFVLSAVVLAACGSNQHGAAQSSGGIAASPTTSATPQRAVQYKAKLALVGSPTVTDDSKSILVTMNVTNDGQGTFGSTSKPHNVNLGAHAIDASGKKVVQDLARGHLPQISPGATVQASILLPVDQTLGNRAEILPVEEGVAWFDQWGTQPLVVGPFKACADASGGTVCDASGKSLSAAPANH